VELEERHALARRAKVAHPSRAGQPTRRRPD
jgi:hypothetical protein